MYSFTVRDLRERNGDLLRDAEAGKFSIVAKHGHPVFVAVPVDERLVQEGVRIALALRLHETLPVTWPLCVNKQRYNENVRSVTATIYASFDEADEADRAKYRSMTPQERLELVSQLRALLHGPDDASAPRLERVLRITELPRS